MVSRKSLLIMLLALLTLSTLSACMSGPLMTPDREIEISVDNALQTQEALRTGMPSGSVTLTESQFSSFITVLIQQNAGDEVPIKSFSAMFDPDQVYLHVQLSQGPLGIDHLGLSGKVMVEDHLVKVDLDHASAGPFGVSGDIAALIGKRLNAALDHPALGTIVNVSMGEGTITLGLETMEMHMDKDADDEHEDDADDADAENEEEADEAADEEDTDTEEEADTDTMLPFEGTFSGTITGDEKSRAELMVVLTQDGDSVTGEVTLGEGLQVNVGRGFCPGVQDVPASTLGLADTISADAPNHLESSSQMNVGGYNVGLEMFADLSDDQSMLNVQVNIKVPFPCTSPELFAMLSRN